MRIIGRIELKFNHEAQTVENGLYADGYIVELTSYEISVLKYLQDACEGLSWKATDMYNDYAARHKPEDIDMSEAFGLIRVFAETKFAVNDFRKMVDKLEDTIGRLDKKSEL